MIFMITTIRSLIPTNITHSSKSAFFKSAINISVFFVKLMPVFAMRFFKIVGGYCVPRHNVFGRRNGLKMIWINAPSIIAKMMNVKAFRNFSFIINVRKAMGVPFFIRRRKTSISSSAMNLSRPFPTAIFKFYEMAKKYFFSVKCRASHVSSFLFGIVRHYNIEGVLSA